VCSSDLPKKNDDVKAHVGFTDPLQGVSGEFTESKEYSARFGYTLEAPAKVSSSQTFPATVTVTNNGDLTDVTEINLYAGTLLGSWRFELRPGETKSHVFTVALNHSSELAVVAGTRMVVRTVTVLPNN
jgi:hypothetical protein